MKPRIITGKRSLKMLPRFAEQTCMVLAVLTTLIDTASGQLYPKAQWPLFSPSRLPLGLSSSDQPPEPSKPKNVVMILSDDQDATMGSISYMPRLKEHIIDQGTYFANHFTTTAICCPSRVSLWTGRQPHNTNVTDVDPPYGGFPKFISQGLNDAYLPVWLQKAGYATYYTGKMFNSHTIDNYNSPHLAGWTSNNFLLDPGTYSYLNPIFQKDFEEPVHHRGKHTTTLIQNHAADLIDLAVKSEKPFFVAIAPIAPHSNIDTNDGGPPVMTDPIPLEKHAHLFASAQIPRTSNFNPAESSGVSWIAQLPRLNDSSVEKLDEFYRKRIRALQGVDELVEQVVFQLEKTGVLDDTYIIFTSDNGYHLGQHRLPPGKECGFEEDIRVPFVIRGPGVSKGTTDRAITSHIDVAPSIFEIAGIPTRDDFDGLPMPFATKSLDNLRTEPREHVAVEYWGTAIAEGEVGGFGKSLCVFSHVGRV
jgi:arylsulfatase A-like enzyme